MSASSSAQNELAQAQKNLEEGKQVRYGNERNYARYQERIKGLENQVKAAQERANAAGGMVDEAVRLGAVAPVSRGLVPSVTRPDVRFVPFAPALAVPLHLVWGPDPTPGASRVVAAARAAAAHRDGREPG